FATSFPLFAGTILGDGYRTKIEDKSSFRYGLFRAKKNRRVLEKVLILIPHAPEHIDLYVHYLDLYDESELIVSQCSQLLKRRIPYEYVIGELWKTLAKLAKRGQKKKLIKLAFRTVSNKYIGNGAKIGAYSFLCSCEKDGLGEFSSWGKSADSVSLSFVTPFIDLQTSGGKKLLPLILSRPLPDPALGITSNILQSRERLSSVKPDARKLHPIVLNSYQILGLMKSSIAHPRNPLGKLLQRSYSLPLWEKWMALLGNDYHFAYEILLQAESVFQINPSSWLSHLDSFNDLLTRKFQNLLDRYKLKGSVRIIDKRGRRIDIGVILSNPTFAKAFPSLVGKLVSIHKRRSMAPSTHPYDKPSGNRTIRVKDRERDKLKRVFGQMISELIAFSNAYL
ncbi:MAG: hypothetical protein WEA61_08230, partial [Anaerolineales bacterium]